MSILAAWLCCVAGFGLGCVAGSSDGDHVAEVAVPFLFTMAIFGVAWLVGAV